MSTLYSALIILEHQLIRYIFTENHIIMEMLEVFINSILYARKVYPAAIFRQRKMYNSAIYVSIFPALNEYITKTLKSALHLLNSKHLYRLQLVIFDEPAAPIERFVFDFWPTQAATEADGDAGSANNSIVTADDEYLVEFEEEARKKLMQLDIKLKKLRPLTNPNTTFKILLETTQTAHVEMTSNPKMQVIYARMLGIFYSDDLMLMMLLFLGFSLDVIG